MYHREIKRVIQLLVLIALVTLTLQPAQAMAPANSNGPELPAQCASIVVPDGHKLAFHVYAKGVQIYSWNVVTSAWDFEAPRASLFAEANFFGEVGSHFRGPYWESKSGSRVKAAIVPGTGCTPDASAVAWLLLKSNETIGAGIFQDITYIQRTNTTGGLRPTDLGTLGEIREIPYTAEYYFYRAENPNGL